MAPTPEPSDARTVADRDSVLELLAAAARLEAQVAALQAAGRAQRLGYFPPDQDEQVKQIILAYRVQRLEFWEILLRHRAYKEVADPRRRLRSFMVAFAAGLALYGKALRVIEAFEHVPLVRAKLNEPDAKFGLGPGFFDQLLVGYSSLSHYRLLAQASRFWRQHRREVARLGLDREPGWEWLPSHLSEERRVVSGRFWQVLRTRFRRDWRQFWRTLILPLDGVRYGLQAWIGGTFAEFRVDPGHRPCLDAAVLRRLRPLLVPGDVLLIRAEGKLTSALLPGFWAHAALYVGGRGELRPFGLENHPHVAPHWAGLAEDGGAHGITLEAVNPKVQLRGQEECLHADHVCVLRPQLPPGQVAAALAEGFSHLGKAYDFDFDFNLGTRLVCTGLVYRAYHGRGAIAFDLIKRMGRWTLSGDDVLQQCLGMLARHPESEAAVFRPVVLVLTDQTRTPQFLPPGEILPALERIQSGWRPIDLRQAAGKGTA